MSQHRIYYIYAYFRPDGRPLYIGKGQAKRWGHHLNQARNIIAGGAWPKNVNPHFLRIIVRALRSGLETPVVVLQDGLTAQEAVRNEVALIAAIGREANGGPLVNLTDGGEGKIGYVTPSATKAKIGAANRGKNRSPEVVARIKMTLKGRPKPIGFGDRVSASLKGKPLSEERRAKISAARRGQKLSAEALARRFEIMGSEAVKAKLREANLGKKASPEARAKMSESQTARWAQRKGAVS